MKNLFLLMVCLLVLSGCASSTSRVSDHTIATIAALDADMGYGLDKGFLQASDVRQIRSRLIEHLNPSTLTEIKKKFFGDAYDKQVAYIESLSDNELYAHCSSLQSQIPQMAESVIEMNQKAQRTAIYHHNQISQFMIELGNTLNKASNSMNQVSQSMNNSVNSIQVPSVNIPLVNSNQKESHGTPVYDTSECIGVVVNGRCIGSVNPNPSNVLRKKCYGTMINGKCIGTIGY